MKAYKRVIVKIPIINPSCSEIKLKRDNERLIKRLEQLDKWAMGN